MPCYNSLNGLGGGGGGGGGHHHHHHHGGGHWGGGYPYMLWGGGYPLNTSILYDIAQATLPCYVKTTGGYRTYSVNSQAECTALGGQLTVPPVSEFGAETDAGSKTSNWVGPVLLVGGLAMLFLCLRK